MKKILLLLVGLIIVACTDGEGNREALLPPNSGKYGEILVVSDSALWDSGIFDKLEEIYQAPVKILPQPEPIFKFVRFRYQDFSPILRLHKNLIFIEGGAEKTSITESRNAWAKDQYIMTFKYDEEQNLVQQMKKNKERILNYFLDADIRRIQNSQKKASLSGLSNELKQKKGYDITIPRDFIVAEKDDQLLYLRREKPELTQFLMIYEEDYVSKDQLTKEYILNLRDSLGEANVFGEADGSYMVTERRMPIFLDVQNIEEQYAMRIRGLWKMQGEMKGGSFVSYAYVDQNRNKLINIEGFLYSPRYKKRFYMQELEAIIRSFKLIQPNTANKN